MGGAACDGFALDGAVAGGAIVGVVVASREEPGAGHLAGSGVGLDGVLKDVLEFAVEGGAVFGGEVSRTAFG